MTTTLIGFEKDKFYRRVSEHPSVRGESTDSNKLSERDKTEDLTLSSARIIRGYCRPVSSLRRYSRRNGYKTDRCKYRWLRSYCDCNDSIAWGHCAPTPPKLLHHIMNTFAVYQKRNKKIRDLGFSSYAEYLASPLWASIRGRVLRRDKHKCQVCGDKATQVHHRSYTVAALRGTCLKAMKAVCRSCHELAEWEGSRKTHLMEANRVIGSGLTFCVRCRKNPTKKGRELCGRCKRESP